MPSLSLRFARPDEGDALHQVERAQHQVLSRLGAHGHPVMVAEAAVDEGQQVALGVLSNLGVNAIQPGEVAVIRAVLEGVIVNLYSILPAVESLVGRSQSIKATGGFARSGLWRQMMADVFNRDVEVPETFESSCLGAAVLGLYALGRIDSLDAVGAMVGATHRHTPVARNVAVYERPLPIFLALPVQLEAQYRQIALFQQQMSAPPATHAGA